MDDIKSEFEAWLDGTYGVNEADDIRANQEICDMMRFVWESATTATLRAIDNPDYRAATEAARSGEAVAVQRRGRVVALREIPVGTKLYTRPPAPVAQECPYPCGWTKLHSIAVRQAAYFASATDDDIPFSVREAGIKLGKYAIELSRMHLPETGGEAPQPAPVVPEGWLLVPATPTPEMMEAALEAHMPFGDIKLAITMANFAAPDMLNAAPGSEYSPAKKLAEGINKIGGDMDADQAMELQDILQGKFPEPTNE